MPRHVRASGFVLVAELRPSVTPDLPTSDFHGREPGSYHMCGRLDTVVEGRAVRPADYGVSRNVQYVTVKSSLVRSLEASVSLLNPPRAIRLLR